MTVSCAVRVNSNASIEIIGDVDAFDALRNDWPDLGSPRFGPLVSHDWWSCAARAFGLRLHVIVIRRAGRLAAVAPLCCVRRRGLERLELIGSRELFEPAQLLAVDADALELLCRALVAQGMPVCLQRIESSDLCLALLAQYGAVRVKPGPSTRLIPRGTEWKSISGSLKTYKSRRRKLEAMGAVTSELLAPTEAEFAPLLDELIAVECKGWKGRRGSSLAQNPALATFMRSFALRLARCGTLRISRLTCGGAPAALQMCAEQDGSFWVIKMGYDEKFAAGSPGLIGHVDLMRYAIEVRGCGFECLGLAEEWQRRWQMHERRYGAVYFYPNNASGIVARVADSLVSLASALRRKGA